MIEMDDAGTGCPILGEVYVARRVETNETVIRFLRFHGINKHTLLSILTEMVMELKPKEEEEITLCRGHYFNALEQTLKKQNYRVKRAEIIGETNDAAEEMFLNELRKKGLPYSIKLVDKDYEMFHNKIMLWYDALYEGESLLKPRKHKLKPKDYILNRVHHHPNLVKKILNIGY